MGFPIYFTIPPLTYAAAKWQPLGVERQISPFWKLETECYNIYENKKNLEFRPRPPWDLSDSVDHGFSSFLDTWEIMVKLGKIYILWRNSKN